MTLPSTGPMWNCAFIHTIYYATFAMPVNVKVAAICSVAKTDLQHQCRPWLKPLQSGHWTK